MTPDPTTFEERMLAAEQAGKAARRRRVFRPRCPFTHGTPAWDAWMKGYGGGVHRGYADDQTTDQPQGV